MKQEYQDQIDKYVLGQMDDTEKSVFEQDVAQDAGLQEQLQFTKDVTSATKSREEKLAKMENWEDDYVFEDNRRVSATNYRPTGSGYDACPSPLVRQVRRCFIGFLVLQLYSLQDSSWQITSSLWKVVTLPVHYPTNMVT